MLAVEEKKLRAAHKINRHSLPLVESSLVNIDFALTEERVNQIIAKIKKKN